MTAAQPVAGTAPVRARWPTAASRRTAAWSAGVLGCCVLAAGSTLAAEPGVASTGPPSIAALVSDSDPTRECRIAGLRNRVRCGVVQRALDPASPEGTKIDVHYVVVPAIARRKLPDPVFVLAGGPGQSAIGVAPGVMGLLQRLGNRRDIVFVDQRGTGRSAPLECADTHHLPMADQVDPDRQVAQLARCQQELQSLAHTGGADGLRFFTTVLAMQDLDAVRRQLGAQRINLVAASYGTRAALDYQRQFPAHVRRSVLDGVAPPDMVLPASFGVDGPAVFDAMLAACEAEAACARRYPALRADWAALLQGLPRPVTVAHPLTGQPERLVLTRDVLFGAVRGPLYSPALAAGLPAAITEAARGNLAALMGMSALLSSRGGTRVAMGMHFSVVCAEDAPLLKGAEAAEGAARLYQRVCADWPRGSVPPAFYTVPTSTTPVLLLSGGLDPATPPRHGERVAKALGPLAQHVVVANAGHGVMGLGCMRDVIHRFIDAADDVQAVAVEAGCASGIPRPPAFQPVGTATAEAAR